MEPNIIYDVINVGDFFCSQNHQNIDKESCEVSGKQIPSRKVPVEAALQQIAIGDSVLCDCENNDSDSYFNMLKIAAESITLFKEQNYSKMADYSAEEIKKIFNQRVAEAEKVFDDLKDVCLSFNKGLYWYLKGKMYNSSPAHRSAASESLVKAVKLDPFRVDAWNELGECYFFLGDSKLAVNCFNGALNRERNKISLRNLSMVCRKDSFTMFGKEREAVVQRGITYAKEAINLDPSDGESWAILGNSYLALFFAGSTDPKSTKMAIQAYRQGEKNGGNSPELHYNKGVALLFCEDYYNSFESFQVVLSLDPTWRLALDMRNNLIKYIDVIQENTKSKGRMKTKRMKQMVSVLQKNPMLGITYRNLTYVAFNMLPVSDCDKVVVSGKVIWSSQLDKCFPFTFGLIDVNCDAITVSVYNLASGKGVLIGDTVALPRPSFSEVEFTINDKVYNIKKIRVSSPRNMLVNNKYLKVEHLGECSLNFHSI